MTEQHRMLVAHALVRYGFPEADRHKLERPEVVSQLQAQATRFGVTISFVEFEDVSVKRTLEP